MMTETQLGRRFFVLTSLVLLAAGIVGIDRLRLRPDVDFRYEDSDGKVLVSEIASSSSVYQAGIRVGDEVVGLNDRSCGSAAQLEFLIDSGKPDLSVALAVHQRGELRTIPAVLVKKFGTRCIVMHLIVGILFWIVGFVVYRYRPQDLAARVFAWGTVIIATSIMLDWPGHPYLAIDIGYLIPAIYCLLYPLVPSYILYFCLLYPSPKRALQRFPSLPALLFFPSFVFVVSYEANYIPAIRSLSTTFFAAYHRIYHFFQAFFVIYFLIAALSLIHAHQYAMTRQDQKRVQWIFLGFIVGGVPFLVLWTIPRLLGFPPLIPEEMNYPFMMAVPLSIAFSVVKYHALDIDIVINRSIVYTAMTGLVIGLYVVIVGSIGFLVPAGNARAGNVISIGATLVAAVLFSPIRMRVQRFVDKTFFKVKYNHSMVIKKVAQTFLSAHDKNRVVDEMLAEINTAIPMLKTAVLARDELNHSFTIVGNRNLTREESHLLTISADSPLASTISADAQPFVRSGWARLDRAQELTDDALPKNSSIHVVVPVVLQHRLTGFLATGGKRSGGRYSEEDIELLRGVAEAGFMTLERLRFQEGMILEHTQRERAEELSRLKSEFVSHVSHELRTPLASIRWAAENLLDGIPEPPSPKIREYLLGIYDSSQRLATMIENLLDHTRIEAGRIELNPQPLVLRPEVERAVSLLKPLAGMKSINLDVGIPEELWVNADRGYLQAILINLLDNAVKYSGTETTVTVAARVVPGEQGQASRVATSILDRGAGIPKEKLPFIFDRFERAQNGKDRKQKGLGLGLHIVRRLVELHGGSIAVESEPGLGSTFTVLLPGADRVERSAMPSAVPPGA